MYLNKQLLVIGGLALALAAALAPAARAQFDADSSAPIEITADSMEWFQEKRIAIAHGNADAVQGRYRLQAETLTAHIKDAAGEGEGESSNKIERIDAEGTVRLSTPEETASGDTGTYDVTGKVAVLIGNVVLTQGQNVMRGERLDMDLVTGRSKLSAGAGAEAGTEPAAGGRVKAIFVPDKKSDEPQR